MTRFIFYVLIFFLVSCDSALEFSNFKNSKTQGGEAAFKKDIEECSYFSKQTLDKAEGSKRAGEVYIENKEKFSNCMLRKGWVEKGI